ncbi:MULTISPECIES: ABC transporter permease subunit [unclassified Pseudodesulfovibrio]|uniref:ABC transporter permease n=1 Tax=unclassified Pseudodesulfovibrio TaxID=2661612 RepID=UPI0013E2E388|nr:MULTISPECIES: ABC transporter permease subunit [unclassified Pseudodesulfovibrio]MCJ2163381.1 ABC transporter permease subunit [Pseudodesulfovibrio sp. S3-i]
MKDAYTRKWPPYAFHLLGLMMLIMGWEMLARTFSGLVVAGPGETLTALFRLVGNETFLTLHMVPTLKRIGLALVFGIGSGTVLGILAGFVEPVRLMLAPARWILMSIPGVIIVVVFMLWFGMGTTMVVCITATMMAPIIYVNVTDGMMNVDRNLLEMAKVYRLPLHMRLMRIYAMALAGPLLSGVVIATGNGIRLVVLAEMLGANEGIGHALAISRANLQTDELYALTLLAMLVIGGVEVLLLSPARKAVQRRRA